MRKHIPVAEHNSSSQKRWMLEAAYVESIVQVHALVWMWTASNTFFSSTGVLCTNSGSPSVHTVILLMNMNRNAIICIKPWTTTVVLFPTIDSTLLFCFFLFNIVFLFLIFSLCFLYNACTSDFSQSCQVTADESFRAETYYCLCVLC